jgi:hypothetical protein
MTALSAALTGAVHTGACLAVPRALVAAAARVSGLFRHEAPVREYCLHDERGRPVGTIEAPAGRPAAGRDAPTVYLRRAH